MDKDKFKEFIDYCGKKGRFSVRPLDRIYKKFGSEFIHSLPVEYKLDQDGEELSVIRGTYWWHSTKHPLYIENGRPVFFILEQELTFDQWLPYSALSSEEQLVFKLKYG